jgi:hypothetical protein
MRTGLLDTLVLAEGKMHVTTGAFILTGMLTRNKAAAELRNERSCLEKWTPHGWV